MRKSSRTQKSIEKFLSGATAEEKESQTEAIDMSDYIIAGSWPIEDKQPKPSLAEGRKDLNKPLFININEQLYNTIERHLTLLGGISKAAWVKHAILSKIEEEQLYFFYKDKDHI